MFSAQQKQKSILDMQPYLFLYSVGTSMFSPSASLYQLLKLNPQVTVPGPQRMLMALRILPRETILKTAQMNVSTPVKEYLNPWAAFAVIGVLQGAIYGHANIYFARELKVGARLSMMGTFRGWGFAGVRDMISQGVPFAVAHKLEKNYVGPAIGANYKSEHGVTEQAARWTSVIGTSVVATYMSQCLHNCQVTMQTDQTLSHYGALRKAYRLNGTSLFYKGAEARVGLLLIVNLLNEAFLKKAWN